MYKMYVECSNMIPFFLFHMIVAVFQSLSHNHFFVTPQTTAHQASLSFSICLCFLKFMSIGSVMLSNQLILYFPLSLWPSIFPSNRIFSNKRSSYRCSINIWWMNKHLKNFIIPIFCTDYSLLWSLLKITFTVLFIWASVIH